MYAAGTGVPRNYQTAVYWFTNAALAGHGGAQNELGLCYGFGKGIDQDHGAATKWFELAAAQNHPAAQFNLAVQYMRGRGVAPGSRGVSGSNVPV